MIHEADLRDIKNRDLAECMSLIENATGYNVYRHMTVRPWALENLTSTEPGRMAAISDAFRFYLLNKYGGIYLDLDTFPVNAFDDALLRYPGFTVNHMKHRRDYFFMGFEKGCVDDGLVRCPQGNGKGQMFSKTVHVIKYYEHIINAFKSRKDALQRRFIAGKLRFGESILSAKGWPEYYIDHYRIGSWRPNDDICR